MVKNIWQRKIATDPSGLKKYLTGFLVVFLVMLLPCSYLFQFALSPLLLTIIFYGIPFILCQYFMYAMVFLFTKKKVLFGVSVVALSVLFFEVFSLVFYNEPYLIHEIKENKFPVLSVINLLSSLIAVTVSVIPESNHD